MPSVSRVADEGALPMVSEGHRAEQGQNLVELALVLPLLILILAGTLDLGRVFYGYIAVTNAAREGARYAASYPDQTPTAVARALAEASGSGLSGVTAIVPAPANGSVTATVSGSFSLVTGLLPGVPKSITLTGHAQMAVLTGP
jgi:Flp pilus assembly protein TadG